MMADASESLESKWWYRAPLVIPVRSMMVPHPAAA